MAQGLAQSFLNKKKHSVRRGSTATSNAKGFGAMRELRELHDSATGGADSFTQLLTQINHCTTKTATERSEEKFSAECCPPDVRYSALHDSLSTREPYI